MLSTAFKSRGQAHGNFIRDSRAQLSYRVSQEGSCSNDHVNCGYMLAQMKDSVRPGPNDYWLLTEADIMKLLRQNDWAYDPSKPDRDLDEHQDKDEGALPVVVFDVLRLDGQGRDKHHQEENVEQGEDMVSGAEVTGLLENSEGQSFSRCLRGKIYIQREY